MLDNNWEIVELFESKLARFTGFKYAITTDCCTNAIIISLEFLSKIEKISKNDVIDITPYTYLSIPMMLKNYNWKINFNNDKWISKYQLGKTLIFDAATDFKENMCNEYNNNSLVCISFQQKKRLALGRGGAILTNNLEYANVLKRMRYDGRNPMLSDNEEIKNNKILFCGFHCYMEPDKAANGILKLNQKSLLPIYKQYSWKDYNDLRQLKIWN